MRSYLLLAALFLFIFGWLFFLHPVEVNMQNVNVPQLQIKKFVFTLLTPQGEEFWLTAQKGIKRGRLLKIWKMEAKYQDERFLAQEGRYSEKLLRLRHNVRFYRKDMAFHCEYALYNISQKILKVPLFFDLHTSTMDIVGYELFYNQKTGTIRARNIIALIKSL